MKRRGHLPTAPCHDNVGPLCHDVDGHSNVLHLTDEERAGVLDTSHKGFGIAKGEQYCARVRGQSQIEEMGLSQEAPSDEADPKGLLLLQLSVGLTEVC